MLLIILLWIPIDIHYPNMPTFKNSIFQFIIMLVSVQLYTPDYHLLGDSHNITPYKCLKNEINKDVAECTYSDVYLPLCTTVCS